MVGLGYVCLYVELYSHLFCPKQCYPVPSLSDDGLNIPPITPPTLPEHALVHMPESEPGGYHLLCPPVSQNGLNPFHPQNMDLPAITVSNMLSQDGPLLSNSLSMVGLSHSLQL